MTINSLISLENLNLILFESAAIVTHILELTMEQHNLLPKLGTKERALYHKFFFFAASTVDHLLFDSYKVY
jgi:glutathione S-transferase